MCKKFVFILVVLICILFACNDLYSSDVNRGNIVEISKLISNGFLDIQPVDNSNVVYLGTKEGLYLSDNLGESWQKVSLPTSVFMVNDIEFEDENIYLLSRGKLYKGDYGVFWERVSFFGEIEGCSRLRDSNVIVWTKNKVFIFDDSMWRDISPRTEINVNYVLCTEGNIFVASNSALYQSLDNGNTWDRIQLLNSSGYTYEENDEIDYLINEDVLDVPKIHKLFNMDKSILVVSNEGLLIVNKKDNSFYRLDSVGIPGRKVVDAVCFSGNFFAAACNGVYSYSPKGNIWRSVFKYAYPDKISCIKLQASRGDDSWLWVVGEKHLFRINIKKFLDVETTVDEDYSFVENLTIQEVQGMAIEYAEVNPDKINRWREKAKWKAILPKVSLGYSQSNDDNIEIYKSATKSYVIEAPRESDNDWSVDLSWDLSDLIWNNAQTSIDVRSKLMVQLREDVLEEVTRLYFERKRLILEIAKLEKDGSTDHDEISEKQLKMEEITAYIDAFTGGQFSNNL